MCGYYPLYKRKHFFIFCVRFCYDYLTHLFLTNKRYDCIFASWFFHNSIRFKVNKVG